jgi:hypothetical protein
VLSSFRKLVDRVDSTTSHYGRLDDTHGESGDGIRDVRKRLIKVVVVVKKVFLIEMSL